MAFRLCTTPLIPFPIQISATMGKKKREQNQPFAIQQLFMHKGKPWRKFSLSKSDSALNTIIRRLKCANASKLFSKNTSEDRVSRSNSIPKYPYLMRNLERSFNTWSSFEQKCREYAEQKDKSKEENEEPQHAEPIVEFPPEEDGEEGCEDNSLINKENNVPKNSNIDKPTTSGLTRWKNTIDLMPSPIVPNQKNRHCLNDYSFETIRSLPTKSPEFFARKTSRNTHQEPMSTTMPFMNQSTESCLPSTPSFMREWKSKSRGRRQFQSTPKNAFS